tara:strand:+ start:2780 stop:3322 length:543 start_codon:yes stop_codon:yes gene_type:complete
LWLQNHDGETRLNTEYHAKLFAHELSKRHSVADSEKLAAKQVRAKLALPEALSAMVEAERQTILDDLATRQARWFDDEMEKLDNWAEDKRTGLKADLKEFDDQIKALKKDIRQTGNLPDKLSLQRQARVLDAKRDEAWREYDAAAREIEVQKDGLLDQVEERLGHDVTDERLFAIRFEIQ